jgi:hypothetical protein
MSDSDVKPDDAPPPPRKELRPRDPERWIRRPIEKHRKKGRGLEFRPSPAFFELADPVVTTKRTLLGYDRLYVFWQAIRNVADVPGAVAEIGSFKGGSAYFMASAFLSITGEEVPMHVFDTFEGHPEQAITEHDPFHKAGQFNGTNHETVCDFLSPFKHLQVHKGDVLESLKDLPESVYRLVHIDTDLYKPTLSCLEHFGARMSPGGVIVLDDYASKNCPGVPKATIEYLEQTHAFQAWDMRTEQLMLVKR